MKITRHIASGSIYAFIFVIMFVTSLCGCESFARKFTRKPKTPAEPAQKMIVVPETYPVPDISKDDMYRGYFLYWDSWQSELLDALSDPNPNMKKQRSCADQALKNLEEMRSLLDESGRSVADVHISAMAVLIRRIAADLYGYNSASNLREAQRLRRDIGRDLQYSRIKDKIL